MIAKKQLTMRLVEIAYQVRADLNESKNLSTIRKFAINGSLQIDTIKKDLSLSVLHHLMKNSLFLNALMYHGR